MRPEFDVIIVGSGPAGVSAAFPLLEAGLRVLMVDGGRRPESVPPQDGFLEVRGHDDRQWKWMVGADLHALKTWDSVSPKLRIPGYAYAFDGFAAANQVVAQDFVAIGSLATGGLSNAWGCGVARFSPLEMKAYPFPSAHLDDSFRRICRRIGISGRSDDDMAEVFGLDAYAQPPLPLDSLHAGLFERYARHRPSLNATGFRLGRSRVAALSQDLGQRQACNLSGNCLWGCARHSLYSAAYDLPALSADANFIHRPGFIVDSVVPHRDGLAIQGRDPRDGQPGTVSASRILMAAGTLATTRLVLKALGHRLPRAMLSCPIAAFLLWFPRRLGTGRGRGFGYGQLSFCLDLGDEVRAFGSTFATTGIAVSEFARHLPLGRRFGIDLLQSLLSSCVVGNCFLPGEYSTATTVLRPDDSLAVTGGYADAATALMQGVAKRLRLAYWTLGGVLLPGSFRMGLPGGDIHYAGTLPMRSSPGPGETSIDGEVAGLPGLHVVDGACLPALPGKSHTLVIMANADRIGRSIGGLAASHKAA